MQKNFKLKRNFENRLNVEPFLFRINTCLLLRVCKTRKACYWFSSGERKTVVLHDARHAVHYDLQLLFTKVLSAA